MALILYWAVKDKDWSYPASDAVAEFRILSRCWSSPVLVEYLGLGFKPAKVPAETGQVHSNYRLLFSDLPLGWIAEKPRLCATQIGYQKQI